MSRAKIIIEIKRCEQCPLFSQLFDAEENEGYSDVYSIDYCNGELMKSSEKQFGSENCELVNPKTTIPIGEGDKIKKVLYVGVK